MLQLLLKDLVRTAARAKLSKNMQVLRCVREEMRLSFLHATLAYIYIEAATVTLLWFLAPSTSR